MPFRTVSNCSGWKPEGFWKSRRAVLPIRSIFMKKRPAWRGELSSLVGSAALRGHLGLHGVVELQAEARFRRTDLVRAKAHRAAEIGSVEKGARKVGAGENGARELRPAQISAA